MNAKEIRDSFKEYVGGEKYKHFVLTIYEVFPLRDRLFFWQEQLLKEFTNRNKIDVIEYPQVYKIFNYCPVHHCELKNDNVPIVDGNSMNSDMSFEQEQQFFPMANINANRDLEKFSYPESVDVLYCKKCRELLKELS